MPVGRLGRTSNLLPYNGVCSGGVWGFSPIEDNFSVHFILMHIKLYVFLLLFFFMPPTTRGIMFSGCSWVCLSVFLSVRVFLSLSVHAECIVNTIYQEVLDVSSPLNFQHWCWFGHGWTLQVLGSEGQSSRSQLGLTCWEMHFWSC